MRGNRGRGIATPWLWDNVREGAGRPLPKWARWLIDLGAWLPTHSGEEGLVRAVVAVPVRDYAGVLAAAGALAGAIGSATTPDLDEHLAELASLPEGTPMRCREANGNNMSFKKFVGMEERSGDIYVCLSGGYSRIASQSRYIAALPADSEPFVRTRTICEREGFVAAITDGDAIEHAFPQDAACAVVGIKAHLEREFELSLQFGSLQGTLQDLVRAAELMPHAADGFRSRILSASGTPDREVIDNTSGAVILDGHAAILRWRSAAYARPWLGVLDRTNPGAERARDALIGERASSIDDIRPPVGPPPAGIELLCYVEPSP